jgi:predicted O-methyltransferase YrrM
MPRFHMDGGESITKWRLDTDTLMFLDRHLQSGMKTLETGSGMSTVAFAIKSTFHTCIVPDAAQVARITNYCEQARISLEKVQFVIERSEFALPVLKGGDYDLALIDGRHGFPTPFLDWYYMTLLLRAGGIVVLDDLHIWTCDLLKNYLLSEPEDWRCVRETTRAAIFEKRIVRK